MNVFLGRFEETAARRLWLLWAIGVGFGLIALCAAMCERLEGGPGVVLSVLAGAEGTGPELIRERTLEFDPGVLDRRLDLPRDFVTLRWVGYVVLPSPCACEFQLRATGEAFLRIDGAETLHREREQHDARVRGSSAVSAGPHRIEVEYRQRSEPPFLRVSWAQGGDLHPMAAEDLFPAPPGTTARILSHAARLLARLGTWASLVVLGGALAAVWRTPRGREAAAIVIPVALLVVAAALRFEVLTGKTWAADHAPSWAVAAQHRIAEWHPSWIVEKSEHPYLGDPWSYIRLGREMQHFYDASIREPMFVYATRFFLGLLGGRDIAVAFCSAAFSVLLVLATYLLGAAAFSRGVGLIAGFAMALEHSVIALSVEGWRDDAFAFFVILSAFALVRLMTTPTFSWALVAGLVGGGACLTRITSVSFLVPAWLFVLFFGRRDAEARRLLGLTVFLTCLSILPFLVTCRIVFHDPFYSINAHTGFYRIAEGLSGREPMSVGHYLFGRGRLLRVGETALLGLTTFPFSQCWTGLDYLRPGVGSTLAALSALGMVLWMFSPLGRFLLVILVTSLVPYAFTWDLPGGAGWRFRAHAYPLYLLAAGYALQTAWSGLAAAVSRKGVGITLARALRIAGILAVAGSVVWGGILVLTPLRVREDLEHGSAAIPIGAAQYSLLLGPGWSAPVDRGNVTVRLAGEESQIWLPLEKGRRYALAFRMDPVEDGEAQTVVVSVNEQPCATVHLLPVGDRMGSYRVLLPPEVARDGWNRLRLHAAHVARTGHDERPFDPRGRAVAFALWIVSVTPLP